MINVIVCIYVISDAGPELQLLSTTVKLLEQPFDIRLSIKSARSKTTSQQQIPKIQALRRRSRHMSTKMLHSVPVGLIGLHRNYVGVL